MMLKINPELVTSLLETFLRDEMHKINIKQAVFGLSGGVDSSVVAAILTRALGKENVHALIMPYQSSNPESQEHGEMLSGQLGISYDVIDISPMIDSFFNLHPEADNIRRGNKMARERMCLLYDYSSAHKSLVIGTSNKTELLLGYGTLWGDLASAINPIGDLYKSQIWDLARFLDIPEEIINKAPSADLWIGQTDEDELGYKYSEIDEFLYYYIDLRYPDDLLFELGYPAEMSHAIKARVQRNQFKRRPPVIAKLSNRTINQDFRYCRDWGV